MAFGTGEGRGIDAVFAQERVAARVKIGAEKMDIRGGLEQAPDGFYIGLDIVSDTGNGDIGLQDAQQFLAAGFLGGVVAHFHGLDLAHHAGNRRFGILPGLLVAAFVHEVACGKPVKLAVTQVERQGIDVLAYIILKDFLFRRKPGGIDLVAFPGPEPAAAGQSEQRAVVFFGVMPEDHLVVPSHGKGLVNRSVRGGRPGQVLLVIPVAAFMGFGHRGAGGMVFRIPPVDDHAHGQAAAHFRDGDLPEASFGVNGNRHARAVRVFR